MEKRSIKISYGFQEVEDFNQQFNIKIDVFSEMKKNAIDIINNWGIELDDFSVETGNNLIVFNQNQIQYRVDWGVNHQEQEYFLKISPNF